jgi:glycosyltransferase involved in cell wall biosynthesis
MDELVSVIVTTKNSESTLDRCLKSVLDQSYNNLEIVFVDNYSTDKTIEIAKKYTKNIYFKGPERSSQRNFAVKKAKGRYVYIIDSDFVLDKDVIRQCIEKIKQGFDAVVVHNSPDSTISWIARVRKFETDMYKYDLTHTASRFFKKSVFEKINGYNEYVIAGEDYDIQNKLNRHGFCTGFIDAEALHLGEPKNFWPHMKKYYDYGKDFVNYQKYNRKESKKQLGFFRLVYFKNYNRFIFHPVKGIVFVFYHFSKFAFGGMGFVIGKLRR